jgi:ParB-like chromosome segregation protein Spo0J
MDEDIKPVKVTNIKLRMMNIDDLVPAEYNPRADLKPSDPEYKKLKKSLQSYDYVEPIIWNEKTNRIVGGHQRLKVMKELGYEEIQVSVINVDEKKEKKLNIALNKISGDWDLEKLHLLLGEIDPADFESIGFDEKEVSKIMDKFSPMEGEAPEFEFTEELLEEHNYIVLYFDNTLDWQVAQDKFNIKSKHALDSKEGYVRKGTGRVIRGADILDRIV